MKNGNTIEFKKAPYKIPIEKIRLTIIKFRNLIFDFNLRPKKIIKNQKIPIITVNIKIGILK
jgi:hypothetical protein